MHFSRDFFLLIALVWAVSGCNTNQAIKGASDSPAMRKSTADAVTVTPKSDLEKSLHGISNVEVGADNEAANVQILNSSNNNVTVRLDGKTIEVPPASAIYEYKPYGTHRAAVGDTVFTFDLNENEKVLINPCKDTIILEEILYSAHRDLYVSSKPEDYTIPLRIISIGNRKYLGAYKIMLNAIFIKDWHFAVNQRPPHEIGTKSPLYRNGLFENNLSYFKISTPAEIREFASSLNRTNEWIALVLKTHVRNFVNGYELSVEQGNFVVVKFPNGIKISVAKGSVNVEDKLELREVNFYKKEEHGKITNQIGVFANCVVEKDGKLLKNKKLGIVLSDKSHQPHILILQ
jgi:hypothetical protein